MNIANIIITYEGTLTDEWKDAELFFERFKRKFSESTGVPVKRLNSLLPKIVAEVALDPSRGLVRNGIIVSPAGIDPYTFNEVVYLELIKRMHSSKEFKFPNVPEKPFPLLSRLHFECYPNVAALSEDVEKMLSQLVAKFNTVVLTGLERRLVKSRLEHIGAGNVTIFGIGAKYDIGCFGMPEYKQSKGFPHPIYIGRMRESKTLLDTLKTKNGFHNYNTLVVSHNYERDLSLPDYLKYHICLVESQGDASIPGTGTPEYEKTYVRRNGRGSVIKSFKDLLVVL